MSNGILVRQMKIIQFLCLLHKDSDIEMRNGLTLFL